MGFRLLILFVCVPLLELWLLMKTGQAIGALPTIALCIITAMAGGMLVRQQGLMTIRRLQMATARNELPAIHLVEAALIMLSGFLLLTPGFGTDIIGFIVLHPRTRHNIAEKLISGISEANPDLKPGPRVIEGQYRRED